jgi:hypothetical protein
MKSDLAHAFFDEVNRRWLLRGAALSTIVAGSVARASPETLPDLGVAETVPQWPRTPPGGKGIALSLRVVERSPESKKVHLRALSGIARPAMCVVRAPSPNGSALLILSGGGYRELTIRCRFRRGAPPGAGRRDRFRAPLPLAA